MTATASSGLPVIFSIDPASTSGCSIHGSTVSLSTPAGSCVIDADQPGDGSYVAASRKQQVVTVTANTRPANTAPGNTAPANTPPRPGSASVGHVSVSGSAARVTVSCSGGSSCTIKLTISVVETLRRGKVTAIEASTRTTNRVRQDHRPLHHHLQKKH